MKRIISLFLAVMLIASLAAVAASAAGTAKVTVKGLDGKSETKTLNVGDNVIVYTYLDTSAVDEGKISAIKGEQTYDDTVLQFVGERDEDGLVVDVDTIFPVAKDKSMGNAGISGIFHFTLSNPSMTKPFVFNGADTKLLVTTYKVIAAGNAEVETTLTTLARSDLYLTKMISDGVYTSAEYEGKVTLHSYVDDPDPVSDKATVKGKITSYLKADDEVEVKLTGNDVDYIDTYKGTDAEYSFTDVPAGEYTLTVSKNNHVTREYTVKAADGEVAQDVKICPLGDVNNDGKTSNFDYSWAVSYCRKQKELDDYQIKCGDVFGSGDGKLKITDAGRILQHIRKEKLLY
jgi:hypothetical protein